MLRLIGRSIQMTIFPDEIGIARQREKLREDELDIDEIDMNRTDGMEAGERGGNGQYQSTNMATHYSTRQDSQSSSANGKNLDFHQQQPQQQTTHPHLYQKHNQSRSTFIPHKKASSREMMDEERRRVKESEYPEVPLSEPVVRQRGRSSTSIDESVIT